MVSIAVDADIVLKEMRRNQSAACHDNIEKQIKAQKSELDKVKNLLADLYPDFKSGILNMEQYLMNKQKYELEQSRLQASIDNLRMPNNGSDVPHQTNAFIEHFKHHGNIDHLTRPLLTELIDRIVVHQDGTLDITFNFTDAFQTAQKFAEEKQSA